MTKFVVDAGVVIRLARESLDVHTRAAALVTVAPFDALFQG